jgi:toxin CcdB
MARYEVFRNPGAHAHKTPYLLDVQSDLLDGFDSRVVIPLRRLPRIPATKRPERLLPALRVLDEDYLLDTPKIAAVPTRILTQPVASLAAEHNRVTAALDFLFQGF